MKQYRRKNATVSRTSPKGGRRGCLCPDGKTYSSKCCDGTLEAQGIGGITLSGVDSAGTIVSQDTTSTVSSTSTALPSQGSSTVTSQDTTNTTVNSTSTQVVSMEITSGTYNVGDSLPLVATFNEEVNVDTTGGTPTVDVNIDENTREFSYIEGCGTDDLTFEYTLVEEDADFTTVEVASDIKLNGGSITDGGGDPVEISTQSITITTDNVTPPAAALSISGNSSINYAENGIDIVETYTANYSVIWSLSGDDSSLFSINSSGELTFNSSPDYESPQDNNTDNIYNVTVTGTYGAQTDSINVAITVTDVIEGVVYGYREFVTCKNITGSNITLTITLKSGTVYQSTITPSQVVSYIQCPYMDDINNTAGIQISSYGIPC